MCTQSSMQQDKQQTRAKRKVNHRLWFPLFVVFLYHVFLTIGGAIELSNVRWASLQTWMYMLMAYFIFSTVIAIWVVCVSLWGIRDKSSSNTEQIFHPAHYRPYILTAFINVGISLLSFTIINGMYNNYSATVIQEFDSYTFVPSPTAPDNVLYLVSRFLSTISSGVVFTMPVSLFAIGLSTANSIYPVWWPKTRAGEEALMATTAGQAPSAVTTAST